MDADAQCTLSAPCTESRPPLQPTLLFPPTSVSTGERKRTHTHRPSAPSPVPRARVPSWFDNAHTRVPCTAEPPNSFDERGAAGPSGVGAGGRDVGPDTPTLATRVA
ncbi:hypothetical protein HYPSUDRAFT_43280 [Hypholoma sublateritium FD-334 SS-4]|uniref:Uncharacterized protein n=1 Tax=Hypholoma sublateritium (strain FD-334 SS-4) TaxID=945553 RepID=A0A0D2NV16_HYPSF|nr:hypothetical protein HYPSUDRAFT_43280 [Hypholoma sublateritium FD-334 SS-4]